MNAELKPFDFVLIGYLCLLTLLNWSTTMRSAEVVVKLFIRIANQVALLYNWFNERTHKIGEAVRLKNLKMRYCRPLGGIA